jgi:hypothetical protein
MSGLSTYLNAQVEHGFVTGHQESLSQYGALR